MGKPHLFVEQSPTESESYRSIALEGAELHSAQDLKFPNVKTMKNHNWV